MSNLVLALDLSTSTGYAIFEKSLGARPRLVKYGTVKIPQAVHMYGDYPYNYIEASRAMAKAVENAVVKLVGYETIVIEEINLGRSRYTQRLLDEIHFAILDLIQARNGDNCQSIVKYVDSSQWRKTLGLSMTKEQKKDNAKLSKAKRAGKVDKKALGIAGKVTKKHLSVIRANEDWGLQLKMKDNDAADAINLGLALCLGAETCTGV